MESLLGMFYNQIRGSQEDIASKGLCYILEKSDNAKKAINTLIQNEININLQVTQFVAQNVGKDLERPDICGYDVNNKEKLIIEAKFWASLTANQPNKYLERLSHGNSVLMFVCPDLRKISLFEELQREITKKYVINKVNSDNFIIELNNKVFIIIKSWSNINELIKNTLQQAREEQLVSDINQIIGFCNIIDKNSFLPITEEDISPAIPKKILSYCDLIDKVIDKLGTTISTQGLKATGQRHGYTRYAKAENLGIGLEVNYVSWAENHDTPFYLYLSEINDNKGWDNSEKIVAIANKIKTQTTYKYFISYDKVCIPLYPLLNDFENKVIECLTNDIKTIVNFFNEEIKS